MSDEAWQRARGLAAEQDWLLTAAQAQACRVLPSEIARRVRSRECHAVLREVYLLDPDLVQELPQRVRWRAALLAHGPASCLVAGTAARACGMQGLPAAETRIEVACVGGVPRHRRPFADIGGRRLDLPEVVVRQLPVAAREVVVADGLPVRHPRLTVVDAALDLDRMSALSLLDSALHQRWLTSDQLQSAVEAAKGRPGIQQLRPLAQIADGRAESPLESRVRLICTDGGVAPDDLQFPVYDGERLVAVGDLAWFQRRHRPLIAEADGKVHGLPEPVFRDRRRGNLLVPQRCDTVRFVWADTLRPPYVLYVVRSALAAS